MLRKYRVLLALILIVDTAKSQQITPFTLNNGGGFSQTTEWSIGESVSIVDFTASSLYLNTGVLQIHNYIITPVNELGLAVFGDQISANL